MLLTNIPTQYIILAQWLGVRIYFKLLTYKVINNKKGKQTMECKSKKCNHKCVTCQHYDKSNDFCKEKEIENCSKRVDTDFSTCTDYIIHEKLIMF